MPKRHQHQRKEITYDSACELLEHTLSDGLRPRILDALAASDDFEESALALRNAMRSHTFPTNGEPLRLQRIVQSFDTRARRAGLHVLESWDYVAHRFAYEITPVLMLDRCALDRIAPSDSAARCPCCSITTSCRCSASSSRAPGTRATRTKTSSARRACSAHCKAPTAATAASSTTSRHCCYVRLALPPRRARLRIASCGASTCSTRRIAGAWRSPAPPCSADICGGACVSCIVATCR